MGSAISNSANKIKLPEHGGANELSEGVFMNEGIQTIIPGLDKIGVVFEEPADCDLQGASGENT